MAEYISKTQKTMLKEVMGQTNFEIFMSNFLGDTKFPDKCECIKYGPFNTTRKHKCKCGQCKVTAERMLELIKNHPFWGQTIEINGKKYYKFITKPKQNIIMNHWKHHPITWQFGGYFGSLKEPIFQIICSTGELYAISSKEQVHGNREKIFIERLNKFQTKYELKFTTVLKEHYTDFHPKDLMPYNDTSDSIESPIIYQKGKFYTEDEIDNMY